MLDHQKLALGEVLKANLLLRRVLRKAPFEASHESLNQKFGRTSFSQSGEDMIVDYVFRLRGITHPSYIDIGANHPFYLSNTALFYTRGCRGLNIEANPHLIDTFSRYRSEDINLNCGVGLKDGEQLQLFILSDPTLSTFSPSEMETYVNTGKYHVVETQSVKTFTLSSLLKEHCDDRCPDFMSIDVEGFDFEIIKSIDFAVHRPKVICIESYNYSTNGAGLLREDLVSYIASQDYYEYANTGLNSVFVCKKFWFI